MSLTYDKILLGGGQRINLMPKPATEETQNTLTSDGNNNREFSNL